MSTTQKYSFRQSVRRITTAAVLVAAVVLGSHVQPPSVSVAEDLVIVDPPRGFISVAMTLGFGISEKASLENLSLDAFRLRVPAGETNASAITLLRMHYPELEIAENSFGEF